MAVHEMTLMSSFIPAFYLILSYVLESKRSGKMLHLFIRIRAPFNHGKQGENVYFFKFLVVERFVLTFAIGVNYFLKLHNT